MRLGSAILLAAALCNRETFAQVKLTLAYEGSKGTEEIGVPRAIADFAHTDLRTALASSAPFDSVVLMKFTYDSKCERLQTHTIAMLTPAKYIQCSRERANLLVPILIMEKDNRRPPFYSATFIMRVDTGVDSLGSSQLDTLCLVAEGSASGFVAPLHKLWELGLTRGPTKRAASGRYHVREVGTHEAVIDCVRNSQHALGAIGDYVSDDVLHEKRVRVSLRYYFIPQSVIVVSSDLAASATSIQQAFQNLFRRDGRKRLQDPRARALSTSSIRLTDVVPYDPREFNAAFADLERMYLRVSGAETPLLVRNARDPILRLAALAVLIIVLGGAMWTGYALAGKHQVGYLVRLIFAVIMICAWFGLLFRPELLGRATALGQVLLAAALGTIARVAYRERRSEPTRAANGVRYLPLVEATAGVSFAFAVLVVLLATEYAIHGEVKLPAESGRHFGVSASLLAFGAALFLERTLSGIGKTISKELGI